MILCAERISRDDSLMKLLLLIPCCCCLACSNSANKEEADRKNLYQTQFFYEQGFPGKAKERAQRIKKSSSRYDEALEWIERIETDDLGPAYQEEFPAY